MQNFSPEEIMHRLRDLEHAVARHVPVGEGTESDLEKRVTALEQRAEVVNGLAEETTDKVEKLWQKVFDVAGVGAAEQAGVTVDAAELKAGDVGEFVAPAQQG
jgi:hypothetical protein